MGLAEVAGRRGFHREGMAEKPMTLFMETTKIAPEKTVGEIQSVLAAFGANAILLEYDINRKVEGVSFKYTSNGADVPFKLPCRWQAIEAMLKREHKRTTYKSEPLEDKARRVAWRQLLRWVEAQMALVQTQMVSVDEVFFPYILTKNGKTTLYELHGPTLAALPAPK